jgi:glucose-6-phosphate dehydrogenase assembly protein OpcA
MNFLKPMEESGDYSKMMTVHTVSPSDIQSTLDSLWDAKENKNKMRASLFNIIFFTKRSAREKYIRKIAYKLIEKFPARILFVSSDPDAQDSLNTGVAVMSTAQGEFDITCDLIEINACGRKEAKVPLLILPHIVPDLPVFLVWSEDPAEDPNLCEELKQFATRIIFDSESTEDLGGFAQGVLEEQKKFSCEIADLNWARLESWRSLISSIFSKEEKLQKLENTRSVTLTYNAHETPFFCHTKIQSIYLQAWLASRLKWQLVSHSPSLLSFQYKAKEKQIGVRLQEAQYSDLAPGMIISLLIETEEGSRLFLSRDTKDPTQISVEYSTATECFLPTKMLVSEGESGQSLVKEICHKGTSEHYIEVLKIIAEGVLTC